MKYIFLILLLLSLMVPRTVSAVQVCEVPSDKITEYNQCQNTPGVSGGDCDKQYRTRCRESSSIESVFGRIVTPPQVANIGQGAAGINRLIRVGIDLLFVIGAISTLFFVIWGAVEYISAGTRKEGAAEARKKITYALMGLALLGLSFFIVRLVGNIVGLGDLFQF